MASPSPIERYELRSGEAGDVDGVMDVMDAAFGTEFGEAWTRSQLVGILPMHGVDLVIAECTDDGSVAGFTLARSVADEAELLLIAVRPESGRQGVGKRLLTHFLTLARSVGLSRVHLEVRDGNEAVNMYRALGFVAVGRRRDYYQGRTGLRHDAITLSRDLTH